jgi:membrane protein YqaA with SNARE-associated domain
MNTPLTTMPTDQIIALAAAPTVARSLWRWVYSLGGLGFIPLGLVDSSIIPLPGSVDVLTIFLSAKQPGLWFYYAVMATIGSVIGGFVTYRLARKGGKETLERKLKPRTLKRFYGLFERWGFAAIAVAALLPPPAPLVPMLLVAGAMQYSVKKFILAMMLGRVVRYSILAYLGARYGRHVLRLMTLHGHATLIAASVLIAVILAAAIYVLVREGKIKIKHKKKSRA